MIIISPSNIKILRLCSFIDDEDIDYGFEVSSQSRTDTTSLIPIFTRSIKTKELNTKWSGHLIPTSQYNKQSDFSRRELNFNYLNYKNSENNYSYICTINNEMILVSNNNTREVFVINFKKNIRFEIRLINSDQGDIVALSNAIAELKFL